MDETSGRLGPGTPDQTAIACTLAGIRSGLWRMLPLTIGNAAYGIVFGVLSANAGLTPAAAVLMSAVVYSGAAQIVALELWRPSPFLPILAIWAAAALVSLRYLLLGAVLRPWFGRAPARRAYGILFFLADQNWALALGVFRTGRRDAGFLLGGGLALYATWVGGTLGLCPLAWWGSRLILGVSRRCWVRRWGQYRAVVAR